MIVVKELIRIGKPMTAYVLLPDRPRRAVGQALRRAEEFGWVSPIGRTGRVNVMWVATDAGREAIKHY